MRTASGGGRGRLEGEPGQTAVEGGKWAAAADAVAGAFGGRRATAHGAVGEMECCKELCAIFTTNDGERLYF